MVQGTSIREGQVYAKQFDSFIRSTGWMVQAISLPVRSLPHAHLVNVKDPSDTKMVSCKTLADSRYFRLMPQRR